MSVFNRLKGLTVSLGLAEEVPSTPAEATASVPPSGQPAVVSSVKSVAPPATIAADPAKVAQLDEMAQTTIMGAMEESGANLIDELATILESFRDSLSDEALLYKSALKFLVKKGIGVAAVIQDFDKCIGALETCKRDFEAQLKAQMNQRIGSRLQQIEQANSTIQEKRAKIVALEGEIASLAASVHELKGNVNEEQAKLELAQSRFTMVYNTTKGEVETHRNKVTRYGEGL